MTATDSILSDGSGFTRRPHHIYNVERGDNGWLVQCDGPPLGPFSSEADAVQRGLEAVRSAREQGHKSQLYVGGREFA